MSAATAACIQSDLNAWRRDFHRHPELGFLEFRTASRVAGALQSLGWNVAVGRSVTAPEARGEPPSADEVAAARAEALTDGADARWLDCFEDGLTGMVGTWDTGKPGPTVAFRFDMDALPVLESADAAHAPAREGFTSRRPGRMHACGHDGHTAIGLGIAKLLPAIARNWRGRVKLVFQPAEEGCRGAQAMVAAGVLDDVDYFLATHLGLSAQQTGLVACGVDGFLAVAKLDATFRGRAAHAGIAPHEGRNALLAAASATLHLHAITRHGAGVSRINVGELHGGGGRNVVADRASLKLEVRGETFAIADYMRVEAERILRAAAALHDVEVSVANVGETKSAGCDAALKAVVRQAAETLPAVTDIADTAHMGGSEDATLMMDAVQRRGGQATYLLVGSELPAGHHHPAFDFDERALPIAVDLTLGVATRLLSAG